MAINTVLTAAEAIIKSELTALRTVQPYDGINVADLIDNISFTAPAVFFGCVGFRDAAGSNDESVSLLRTGGYEDVILARFNALCIGKHARRRADAYNQARLTAESLALLLYRQDWQLEICGSAFNRRIDAVGNRAVANSTTSLWMVDWWHAVAVNGDALQEAWATLEKIEGYDAEHVDADDVVRMQTQETYPEENP